MPIEAIIESSAVQPFFKNGYLLACPRTLDCFYIDPGDEAQDLLSRITALGLRLVSIVNTHAHMDHICGVGRVKEVWDVPIYLHRDDLPLYRNLPVQGQWFGLSYEPAPPVDRFLTEAEPLRLGDLEVRVHHTPGHSPGHVCLEVGNHVFCGDTVFAGSIGRTDLPGGSYDTLMASIRERILPLGDGKELHPGHGPETTIGRERKTNPFLNS